MATIEIDGKKIEVDGQKMLIEVADDAGIPIPRFCYHKKLTVAANCRMCLVEVEKAPKPLPACATPVMDGMKVFTKSPRALSAQKAVMEFLLINHPLDCPICDQGGECELQDVSMGYGTDVSRFTEGKRVIEDEDLGSLISTDMTRCIHCTRCVRFGEEIAGVRELGATGRGENMRIGTYVKSAMHSPVSGNIIDLCPVGALTAKPSRFTARAWELEAKEGISPHDCLGSNVYYHTRRNQIMRVIPKENEAINETWLADRDRFAYAGLYHADRVSTPRIKKNGVWVDTDWETALVFAVEKLQHIQSSKGAEKIGALAHPSSTTEEMYLLQKLTRGLGSNNIDHRLQDTDFHDQAVAPLFPVSTIPYAELENQQAILLIGSDIENEQPLAALRLRKAIRKHGASVISLNAHDTSVDFPIEQSVKVSIQQFVDTLAKIAKACSAYAPLPQEAERLLAAVTVDDDAKHIAAKLHECSHSAIIIGAIAQHHPQAATIRSLAGLIAQLTQSGFVPMTTGANSAGAWLAGAVPHRQEAGMAALKVGLNANAQWDQFLDAYVLLNVEPEFDCANPHQALAALSAAECVVAITSYQTQTMLDYADVILPCATFAETSGTYVNIDGVFQSFAGAVKPAGETRPAWKILRVLGNLFTLDGFEYTSSEDVLAELQMRCKQNPFSEAGWYCPSSLPHHDKAEFRRLGQWGMYQTDACVRRSNPLQLSLTQQPLVMRISTNTAKHFNLRNGKEAIAIQQGREMTFTVTIDDTLSDGCVAIPAGMSESVNLAEAFGEITLK